MNMSQSSVASRPKQKKPQKNGRRVRGPYTLGGCFNCRRRHVKCDQVKPICLTCRACGIPCEGFSTGLHWVGTSSASKDESSPDSVKAPRRHLYSEKSRASMASAISASVASSSVDSALLEIDIHSKKPDCTDPSGFAVGPFGLFDANIGHLPSELPSDDNKMPMDGPAIHCPPRHLEEPQYLAQTPPPEFLLGGDSTINDPTHSSDVYLGWTDLFGLDFELLSEPHTAGNLVGLPISGASDSLPQNFAGYDVPVGDVSLADHADVPIHKLNYNSAPEPEYTSVDLHSPDIHLLLRKYGSMVIPHMASLPPGIESGWGPMNHEIAIHTLAEVMFLRMSAIKPVKLANLHAVLATSSYYLSATGLEPQQTPEYWLSLSGRAFRDAKIYLQRSLDTEAKGPRSAKYKEQLMATQSLMAHAWVIGDEKDARRLLIECEGLMRLRGLAKREISRTTRLLHHAYTWTRIIGESSYVLHDYKSFQEAIRSRECDPPIPDWAAPGVVQKPVGTQPHHENTKLDDFLRIGHRFEGADSNLEKKDAQAGIQDIHLEDPRGSVEDAFHFIYGIPEQWLSLLSRTTRLANWLDAVEIPEKLTDEDLLEKLQSRARNLEDAVCAFVGSPRSESSDTPNQAPNEYMYRCLTAALLIFFYRRIRDVHPLMLQVYVDEIIQGLEDFDASLVRCNHPGSASPWAAFMAGCEAMGESRRQKLSKWMDRAYESCGFRSYKSAKEHMVEVWRRADQAEKGEGKPAARPSWMQVSRELGRWIILF